MKIIADRDRCAGAGMCALTAPEHFDQDDADGLVVLLADEAEDCDTEVAEAVDLCPSGALRLR
ncbi:ferredoxin [Glycomyces albidus]|uniref:Ferredoxin n=1 Tax=Glycomyces albidus TaxID=2656774 RepID=A0A6L5G8V9_9ACTN|nr:ferredoxin [Glycomyces albidus]MQM26056.1 ferredoxin [Glycomyces albidus]